MGKKQTGARFKTLHVGSNCTHKDREKTNIILYAWLCYTQEYGLLMKQNLIFSASLHHWLSEEGAVGRRKENDFDHLLANPNDPRMTKKFQNIIDLRVNGQIFNLQDQHRLNGKTWKDGDSEWYWQSLRGNVGGGRANCAILDQRNVRFLKGNIWNYRKT